MGRPWIESLKRVLAASFEVAVFLHVRARRAGVKKADSLRNFNAKAVDYDSKFEEYMKDAHPIVLTELKKMSFSSILDLGCGTGTILSTISCNIEKIGLDISRNMIYEAKQKVDGGAGLVVGDSEMLPFVNGSFDVVTSVLAFHHFEQPEIAISEMRRVLRKGGRIMISDTYVPIFWHRVRVNTLTLAFSNRGDVHFYSKSEINWLLHRAGFRPAVWKKTRKSFVAIGVKD